MLPERFDNPTPIGRGGQGETFRAFDRQTERDVAVKVLTLAGREWKDFELFEGHPLSEDLAKQRRRTEAQLMTVLQGVLDILAYLHALRPKVIHRDIKPGNLIERDDGRIALVDFGGVTHALRSKGGSTMIGTFGYMAPEQLYGRAGPHADLYALGRRSRRSPAGSRRRSCRAGGWTSTRESTQGPAGPPPAARVEVGQARGVRRRPDATAGRRWAAQCRSRGGGGPGAADLHEHRDVAGRAAAAGDQPGIGRRAVPRGWSGGAGGPGVVDRADAVRRAELFHAAVARPRREVVKTKAAARVPARAG